MHMTPKMIVIGGLAVVLTVVAFVVFLPYFVFQPAPTYDTYPYSELEARGRQLYVDNGCLYCHSQFTRPNDVTPSKVSQAGEYAYNRPHQLGTLRTGPDLANIGFKRGDRWEIDHLKFPRHYTPNSIMPSFRFLSDADAAAIVAYLNTLGNKQNATTDLMIKAPYDTWKQPFQVTEETWNEGRKIYAEKCLTCHGCAGKGDGPYAYLNNARPADLRQPRFKNLPSGWDMWRVSEGVPGTVMPIWKQSLSERDRALVILFVSHAFMDMVPHFTDEGDLPPKYANLKDPVAPNEKNLDEGKAIFVGNCSFCHGYAGIGDGPDAPGLQPGPPNFSERDVYQDWVPGDWYWRVSDSLPLRAMPQWHTWFDPRQIWLASNYVRDMLALTDPKREPSDAETPANYDGLKMPPTANVMRGREVFLKRCWMCHGDAGNGTGPDGVNLGPPPANFTDADVAKMNDGRWFWRVSAGVGNSAMPPWGLLLAEQDRWDAVKYIKETFVFPSEPKDVSDKTPVEYEALTSDWPNSADARSRGKVIYDTLCATCHGAEALGNGPDGGHLMPTPANLTEDPAVGSDESWWYWRIDQGVVGDDNTHPTAMPAWRFILDDAQKWYVVYYARSLAGAKGAPPLEPALKQPTFAVRAPAPQIQLLGNEGFVPDAAPATPAGKP